MTIEILTKIIRDTLQNVPYKPFFCLPMSAILYATLKDNHGVDAKLITGDLHFKDSVIFQQDFSMSTVKDNVFQTWAGHAWVTIDNLICDLSIFRTLYSEQFTKPCKNELINLFGMGRGCLLGTSAEMENNYGLKYKAIEQLPDEMATGIIKGFDTLLKAT